MRICAKPENRENQFSKLKELLQSRGYSNRMIEAALDRARGIPRIKALRRVLRKEEDKRPVFALTYDPRLPQIQPTMAKHWRAMIGQDPYLSEVFKQPPLTAFKRQRNIRDHLIRARVPKYTKLHLPREKRGMKRCNKNCTACPYVKEVKYMKINKGEWKVNQSLNCERSNCIYLIECKKNNCKAVYVGETKRTIKDRLSDHRGYVNNEKTETATGQHFNLPGHSLSDLTITVLEVVKKKDDLYRKEREKYFIR